MAWHCSSSRRERGAACSGWDSRTCETIETNWSRDGLRLKNHNLRRCCRLQDRGAVQWRSESGWRIFAHRRGGGEARLARGGIQEHVKRLRQIGAEMV